MRYRGANRGAAGDVAASRPRAKARGASVTGKVREKGEIDKPAAEDRIPTFVEPPADVPPDWHGRVNADRIALALMGGDAALPAWLAWCRSMGYTTPSKAQIDAARRLVNAVVRSLYPGKSAPVEWRRARLALDVLQETSDTVVAAVEAALADLPETEDERKADYFAAIRSYINARGKGFFLGGGPAIGSMAQRHDARFADLDPEWFEAQLARIKDKPGPDRVSAKRIAIVVAQRVGAFGWSANAPYERLERELDAACRRVRKAAKETMARRPN